MPYSVTTFETGPGFARYQLGGQEEFTVLAVSFLADVLAGGPLDDDDIFVDYRNPNGQVIYRQYVDENNQPPSFYSLSPQSEPFVSGGSSPTWPQNTPGQAGQSLTERLAPHTLTPGCTVNIYAHKGQFSLPLTDPMADLDTQYVFTAHMWVEDTNVKGKDFAEPPPLLTHVEA